MASLGLPGLAGFWGEFPALLSAYSPNFGLDTSLYRTLMVISAVGTVLAAAYLLWLYQRTAFGTPPAEFAGGHDTHGQVAHSLSAAANADHTPNADHTDHEHADIHDVTVIEWIAWTPFLHRDRAVRCLPEHHVQGLRSGGHQTRRSSGGRHSVIAAALGSLLAQASDWQAPRSTGTRSHPRWC